MLSFVEEIETPFSRPFFYNNKLVNSLNVIVVVIVMSYFLSRNTKSICFGSVETWIVLFVRQRQNMKTFRHFCYASRFKQNNLYCGLKQYKQ